MQTIEVVIETLLLDGFEPADCRRFSTVLQGELTKLLSERGLPSGLLFNTGGQEQISVPTIQVEEGSPLDSIGMQVAMSIYERMEQ